MLHELMQKSLLENRWDEEFQKETINEILAENGGALWSMDLSFDAAREQVLERSKDFEAFAQRFVGDKPKVSKFKFSFLFEERETNQASLIASRPTRFC